MDSRDGTSQLRETTRPVSHPARKPLATQSASAVPVASTEEKLKPQYQVYPKVSTRDPKFQLQTTFCGNFHNSVLGLVRGRTTITNSTKHHLHVERTSTPLCGFLAQHVAPQQEDNEELLQWGYGDREALVRDRGGNASRLPEWTSVAEEIRYNTSTLETKTKKLHTLQSNLVRTPSLDDNNPDELQLTTLSNEVTKLLERCRSLALQLDRVPASGREKHLKDSVVKALMISLHSLNAAYSSSCASYTHSMQSLKQTSSFGGDPSYDVFEEFQGESSPGWTEEQLKFLASNQSAVIAGREKAVQSILRSTLRLNQLFRDVAHLVHEQGTLVDRIDCNIETTSVKVREGREQLQKAHHHQKKNRNLICILSLAAAIVILILLLVYVKS
ncbi:Target SNARE coiled-coil domain [Trinorchestia longiramus]|nr:Target SNARE coiled-coil domain [Trinorchestia longiramus]